MFALFSSMGYPLRKGNFLPGNVDVFALKKWFLEHRRALPWREDPTPYRVWISEVMLQQTQVATVIGYFERWMRQFPSVESVAQAPIEVLMKAWEGLGYYSRVRQIHQTARNLMESYGGRFPDSREALEQLPGIGSYTAGAILSFAFHKKAVAIDGNVSRVLARYTALEEEISSRKAQKYLLDYAIERLPDHEPWLCMEGLIELGAMVCTPRPRCFVCPLQGGCQGLQQGVADLLPVKKKKAAITQLKRYVPVVIAENACLLKKGEKSQVMEGLYQFPYWDVEEASEPAVVKVHLQRHFQLDADFKRELSKVSHHFTRYRALLYPAVWVSAEKKPVPSYEWIEIDQLDRLPFCAGHRQIFLEGKLHAHSTH